MRCIIGKRIIKTLLIFSMVYLMSFSVSALERAMIDSDSRTISGCNILCAYDSDTITVSNEVNQADEKTAQTDIGEAKDISKDFGYSDDDKKIVLFLLAVLVILFLTTVIMAVIPNRKTKSE